MYRSLRYLPMKGGALLLVDVQPDVVEKETEVCRGKLGGKWE